MTFWTGARSAEIRCQGTGMEDPESEKPTPGNTPRRPDRGVVTWGGTLRVAFVFLVLALGVVACGRFLSSLANN